VPAGDWVRGWRSDGSGRFQAGPERLELEAAGMQSPFEQRVVVAAAPGGARVVVLDVVGAPMTQINGTSELMSQIHDA
jgi:hypothetical protein